MAVMMYAQTYVPNQKAKDQIASLAPKNTPTPAPAKKDEKPHTHPPGFVHDEDKEKAEKAEIEAEIKRQ
jgi:hypothetical protein